MSSIPEATPIRLTGEECAVLEGSGGKILQTSLTHEEEAKLQAALDAAGPADTA